MPTYEYKCSHCGHALEAFQRISDESLVDCPECGQSTLRRLISASSFRLKGTGWYVTDFKDQGKSANKKSANNDKQDSKAPETKTPKKKDPTPQASGDS